MNPLNVTQDFITAAMGGGPLYDAPFLLVMSFLFNRKILGRFCLPLRPLFPPHSIVEWTFSCVTSYSNFMQSSPSIIGTLLKSTPQGIFEPLAVCLNVANRHIIADGIF